MHFGVYSVESVLRIQLSLSMISFAMHGVACVKLGYSGLDDREDIWVLYLVALYPVLRSYWEITYTGPYIFLNKRVLLSQQSSLVVAKNISYNLNLSMIFIATIPT